MAQVPQLRPEKDGIMNVTSSSATRAGTIVAALGTLSRLYSGAFVSLLKKAGLITAGVTSLSEVMESDGKHNRRMDRQPPEPVSIFLSVRGIAPIVPLLDPSDREGFLRWNMGPGTHVTITGLAQQAPCHNGYLQVQLLRAIHYYYEFVGIDGKNYYFRGAKDLTDSDRLRGSRTLYGGVHLASSNDKLIESTTFFGKEQYPLKLLRFLLSFRIG
jgi:hypothetical protein